MTCCTESLGRSLKKEEAPGNAGRAGDGEKCEHDRMTRSVVFFGRRCIKINQPIISVLKKYSGKNKQTNPLFFLVYLVLFFFLTVCVHFETPCLVALSPFKTPLVPSLWPRGSTGLMSRPTR